MSQLTDQGFVSKTVEEIQDGISAQQLQTIDAALDLSADQPLGQLNGIQAASQAELWELVATIANFLNRKAAEGFILDNIGDLTGTPRQKATKSTVTCQVNLGAGFSQPRGAMMANIAGQPNVRFINQGTVTSTTAGVYNAVFESIDFGPVAANAGTLNVITAAVSGWNSITNPLDATLGTLEETDTAYRIRQETELSAAGSSTVDGLRADILRVAGVQECFIFENTQFAADENGLPPKSFEAVIYDGLSPSADNQQVFDVIWQNKPSGVEAFGDITGTSLDSRGDPRNVAFSRAEVDNVYFIFTISVDQDFPDDGVDQVKTAVATRALQVLKLGSDVIALTFKSAAQGVLGVVDVPQLLLGLAPNPTSEANIPISSHQIVRVDTSNIIVNVVPA